MRLRSRGAATGINYSFSQAKISITPRSKLRDCLSFATPPGPVPKKQNINLNYLSVYLSPKPLPFSLFYPRNFSVSLLLCFKGNFTVISQRNTSLNLVWRYTTCHGWWDWLGCILLAKRWGSFALSSRQGFALHTASEESWKLGPKNARINQKSFVRRQGINNKFFFGDNCWEEEMQFCV